ADGTPAVLVNYDVQATNGTLTVEKRSLVMSAADKSMVYGAAIQPFPGSISGVQNSDPVTLSFTSGVDQSTGIGTYAIVPHADGRSEERREGKEYGTNGTLTVEKKPLVISADDKSKLYGASNPAFSGSDSGG